MEVPIAEMPRNLTVSFLLRAGELSKMTYIKIIKPRAKANESVQIHLASFRTWKQHGRETCMSLNLQMLYDFFREV